MLLLGCPTNVSSLGITKESFGLHHHALTYGVNWPLCSFGAIRLWDSGTRWTQIQPAPEQWDFRNLDAYVERAESAGILPVLTLGQTPDWAAKDPTAGNSYGRGAKSPPADLAYWRNYVRALALRYNGRILHWEIWNEVNASNFWSGSVAELVELERVASLTLKQVNPNNVVLSPSFVADELDEFDAFLGMGGGQYSDIISYHFYALRFQPEKILPRINRVRKILAKHNLADKPIWNTEIGWLMANSDGAFGKTFKPSWNNWKRYSYEGSAGLVLRALAISFAGGIDHVFWYSWNSGAMGLAENRGADPKPAAQAFQAGFDWLVDTKMKGCEQQGGRWVCEAAVDNRTRYLAWATSPKQFTLPSEWNVNLVTNIWGETRAISPGETVTLKEEPVLFSDGHVTTNACMKAR